MSEPLLPWQADGPYNQLPLLPPAIELASAQITTDSCWK
jgi:hypothetical protein